MNISAPRVLSIVGAVLLVAAGGCSRAGSPNSEVSQARREQTPGTLARPSHQDDIPARDLSVDESMGGHTLARHVGQADADLADRLRREPEIASASTYTDRRTAERTVAAALASAGGKLAEWQQRHGRRPNLVLHVVDRSRSIGRSLSRGRLTSVLCNRAVVVLRWDEHADRFYVLTSYPEEGR